jgi:HPt (histidine-containing phosphotransfer) domain-containing protein
MVYLQNAKSGAIYRRSGGQDRANAWHGDCILHPRILVSHLGRPREARQPEQDRMSTTRSNDSSLGAPALIDDVATAALAADVGPASLVTVLLAFCDELQRRAPLLKVALEDADLAAIGRETHSIKGSALTFGAAALGAAARRANDASRSGDAATALASGREVLALMPETRAAVARLAEQTAEVQQ